MTYDLIIIGGGPAGITAGIYDARKKIKTLLITKDFIGQVAKTAEVENYPGFKKISGIDLTKKLEAHLREFEIEIREGEKVKKIRKKGKNFEVNTAEGKNFEAKSIIIATGGDPRPLEVPGEKEFIGKGVSYCSTCDAPFFKEKKVAVIGGGNTGFEATLDLEKYAKKILIFERSDKVTADEILQEKVKSLGKVEILLNKEVKEIKGERNIDSLLYQDKISQKSERIPIDGVFVQIGSVPATAFVKSLVDFNEKDEIKIDTKTCATSTPGIFAAGDVTDIKYKQIIIAAGEGAKAALSAYEYLQKMEK
jgi:thioredoxin-disulfide reductase